MLLANRRKAATMLVALGPERATEILRGLDETQVRDLLAEVAAVGEVTPEEAAAVLKEAANEIIKRRSVKSGGLPYATELLERALGEDRARQMAGDIDPMSSRPFGYLTSADPEVVAGALAPEPAVSVALALAHLEPQESAPILGHLPDELRADVALRMASLARTHPEVITEVDESFRRMVLPLLQSDVVDVPGIDNLIQILNRSPKDQAAALLDDIEQRDPELATQIRDALFVFDDLVILDDQAIQQVLKTIDTRELATALKDAEADVTAKIMQNLSERARENLTEEVEFLRNVKKSDIEDARKKVVRIVRQLEDAGTIVIDREGGE